jgi:hypothetical protein
MTTITYYTLTRLHWPTSQLSVTFSNYHRLYIFTFPVSVSYRDLNNSSRELLLRNWLVGLLLTNCLLRHSSSSYITLNRMSVIQQRARWELCCVRSPCLQRRCLGNERDAVWRYRGLLCSNTRCGSAHTARHSTAWHGEDTASPTAVQRVLGHKALSGRLPSNALLRYPTMGWHVTILWNDTSKLMFNTICHE